MCYSAHLYSLGCVFTPDKPLDEFLEHLLGYRRVTVGRSLLEALMVTHGYFLLSDWLIVIKDVSFCHKKY